MRRMAMSVIENYLKQLKRELKTESEIKNKIIDDIRLDIEMHIADGKSAEEALEIIGKPSEVAKEFNLNYPEYKINRRQHIMCIVTIVCTAIATVCLLIGLIGRSTYFGSNQVSNVGGVDLPDQVIVTAEPISSLVLFDSLIKISIGLFLFVILCVGYLIIKSKKERWQIE